MDKEQQQAQDQRNVQNNANNIRNAADVAIASKNPYAMAAGAAIKAADKFTGGKSTEMAGKALNQANKMTPGGQQVQDGLNKLSESGLSDKAGKAASAYNGMKGGGNDSGAANNPDAAQKSNSTPTGGGTGRKSSLSSFFDQEDEKLKNEQENGNDDAEISATVGGDATIKKVSILAMPLIGLILVFVMIVGAFGGGVVTDFEDALGASSISGGETGNIVFEPSSKEAKKFYDRINTVKLAYQASGKTVDVLKIAAVYHVMNVNNNDYDYDYMTITRINEIANAMFEENLYSETTFKNKLTNAIFLKYFPTYSVSEREALTEEVFDYIDRYFSFIGSERTSTTCAASGTCNYDIKGFWLPSAGSVSKPMQISNLMVRLMECGSPYGNGSYTTPINQDLVPFEEYIAGVANAEIGSYSHIEAIKAQMVAARSYALARPTAMGNSAGKKLEQENGQWILQISSCVADQVFCNINEGCSYMGGGDGQGGICRSGKVAGAVRTRDALAADNQLRIAAAATQGEVLVNDEGYIIHAGYVSTDQHEFIKYAEQGMNYKQILLQVYNSNRRPYNAADIQKMTCNNGSSSCGTAASGPYASWKQYEGPWTNVYLGNSGKTIRQIGCLATSVSMLIAKSGVPTVLNELNPGTFVEYLSKNGGFISGGNFVWASASKVAPSFQFHNIYSVENYSRSQKLNKINELLGQGCYLTAEVKGNTGQHWVAIDSVAGSTVIMMDPGSANTDMWAQYDWWNTSRLSCYKVVS